MMKKDCFYDNWEQFKSEFDKDIFTAKSRYSEREFIFRGQGSSDFKLTSTFDREFPQLNGKSKEDEANKLLEIFEEECDYYIPELKSMDKFEKLAFDRHYGLPTRLLDWSYSRFLAAVFAFSSSYVRGYDGDIAIYALNIKAPIISETCGVNIIQPRSSTNYRQKYQQSLYTLLNTYHNSLDEYIEEYEIKYPCWWRCQIIQYLGKPKKLFLMCVRMHFISGIRFIAYLHSLMIKKGA